MRERNKTLKLRGIFFIELKKIKDMENCRRA